MRFASIFFLVTGTTEFIGGRKTPFKNVEMCNYEDKSKHLNSVQVSHFGDIFKCEMDGPTNGTPDRQTDRRTDGPTDRATDGHIFF